MLRDHSRYKFLTRRAALLGGAQLLVAGGLVGRMYQLQILQADRYAVLSDQNRMSFRLILPSRGRILDRYGVPIALNITNYQVVLVPEETPDIGRTLDLLGRIIPIADYERRRILDDIRRKRRFVPTIVKEDIPWNDVARIEVNARDLPGISIDAGLSRHYPMNEAYCHVVGYVAAVSSEDYRDEPLFQLPGFRIGKSGIEKQYDQKLRGQAGSRQVEVNALGRVIRELDRHNSHPGQDLTLTIDDSLQALARERIGSLNGACVVMEVNTGEILALVSTPGFDPNAFNKGLIEKDWSKLRSNPHAPLMNKAVFGQYAPGSTFKMIVALAALEAGIIEPDETLFCEGVLRLGDSKFHCWKKEGHGHVDMKAALSQSCDVYFYKISQKLGIEKITDMARRFGFGETSGIDLPNERGGLIPSPEWKQAVIGEPWQKGETLISAIGQGYVLATPLQLAVMTARLVNGGNAVTPCLIPRLLEETSDSLPLPETAILGASPPGANRPFKSLGISASSLAVIHQGMEAAVNEPSGTAFQARIHRRDHKMGGKTGTSQVRRIGQWEREHGVIKNEDLEWQKRDHALFVGYAPLQAPRYACSVIVEHGGSGSKVAAPIARDLLLAAQKPIMAPSSENGSRKHFSHAG